MNGHRAPVFKLCPAMSMNRFLARVRLSIEKNPLPRMPTFISGYLLRQYGPASGLTGNLPAQKHSMLAGPDQRMQFGPVDAISQLALRGGCVREQQRRHAPAQGQGAG